MVALLVRKRSLVGFALSRSLCTRITHSMAGPRYVGDCLGNKRSTGRVCVCCHTAVIPTPAVCGTLVELCVQERTVPACGWGGKYQLCTKPHTHVSASRTFVRGSDSLVPCVLLRHLADRVVQTCLFKLVPRRCWMARQHPVGRTCIIVYMVSSTAL
jgi:hypothetical protein